MDEVHSLARRVVTAGFQPDRTSAELLAKAYQVLDGRAEDERATTTSVQAGPETSLGAGSVQEAGR